MDRGHATPYRSSPGWSPWQSHRKRAAGSWNTGQFHRAAVRFGHPFDDRQAQAEAAILPRARFVAAVKALEDMRDGLWSDARPGIGNADRDVSAAGLQGDGHATAFRGVANGVVDEEIGRAHV